MKIFDFISQKILRSSVMSWGLKAFMMVALLCQLNVAFAAQKTIHYVYSSHCRYCDIFESKVLSDSEVQSLLSKFDFKKVTAKSTNPRVSVTPTVIVYENNKIIKKWVPSLDKKSFIKILRDLQ